MIPLFFLDENSSIFTSEGFNNWCFQIFMSMGTKAVPSTESFMWFSFIHISLLALHKTHIIYTVRVGSWKEADTFSCRRHPTHTHSPISSQVNTYRCTITICSEWALQSGTVPLSPECTSDASPRCAKRSFKCTPCRRGRCLWWQSILCQLNGALYSDTSPSMAAGRQVVDRIITSLTCKQSRMCRKSVSLPQWFIMEVKFIQK